MTTAALVSLVLILVSLLSVPVGDQAHALDFYTRILGFVVKRDIPVGEARWLTVTSPVDPDGPELLLEPNAEYPAMKALRESLVNDGLPIAAFEVDDVEQEVERLQNLGVEFTVETTEYDGAKFAIFDDTCGNLVQVFQNPE